MKNVVIVSICNKLKLFEYVLKEDMLDFFGLVQCIKNNFNQDSFI